MQKKQSQKSVQLPKGQQQPDVRKLHGAENSAGAKHSTAIRSRQSLVGVTLLGDDPENMEWEAGWNREER